MASVVVHRGLRRPCARTIEPSGATHFKLALEKITGVVYDQAGADSSRRAAAAKAPALTALDACTDHAQCAVCLEPWMVGDEVRTLPCLHRLHTACIDPWLRQNATCPVCKYPAVGGST